MSEEARYRLTDLGHKAALDPESCDCRWIFSGKFVGCALCSTIYGKWIANHWTQLPTEKKEWPKGR